MPISPLLFKEMERLKAKKNLFCLLITVLLSLSISASQLEQMGGAGLATVTGLDAVLYNPAAVTGLTERYVGGSYSYTGSTLIAIGYLEPGFSERYNPQITNYRLAGGLTWVRDTADLYKNKYYYTVGFCTKPVYGGINLIYKHDKNRADAFSLDVAIGTRLFDKLTTTLAVENLINWVFSRNDALGNVPHIRLGLTYEAFQGFMASLDASTRLQNKANLSLGAAYSLKSFTFRGGIGLLFDFEEEKVKTRPGLGISYKKTTDSKGAFDLDLALSYIDGQIGHSASFGYTFN